MYSPRALLEARICCRRALDRASASLQALRPCAQQFARRHGDAAEEPATACVPVLVSIPRRGHLHVEEMPGVLRLIREDEEGIRVLAEELPHHRLLVRHPECGILEAAVHDVELVAGASGGKEKRVLIEETAHRLGPVPARERLVVLGSGFSGRCCRFRPCDPMWRPPGRAADREFPRARRRSGRFAPGAESRPAGPECWSR
jgi:hypothetical protein